MGIIWALIVGGIIGWLAGLIIGRDVPGGIIGNIIAGFIGAWVGSLILGEWGPEAGGFYIIPALIGAICSHINFNLHYEEFKKKLETRLSIILLCKQYIVDANCFFINVRNKTNITIQQHLMAKVLFFCG